MDGSLLSADSAMVPTATRKGIDVKPQWSPHGAVHDDDEKSVAILWRWTSVPLFLYCAGMWLRTQTGSVAVGNLIPTDPEVAIVFGLFAAPLAFASLWLAGQYARLQQKLPLAERVPWIIPGELRGRTVRPFRLLLFIGLWVVIIGSQIHFVQGLLAGEVFDTTTGSGRPVAKGVWQMLFKWPAAGVFSHDYRFGSVHGVTYFPMLESWFWLLMVAGLITWLAIYGFRRLLIATALA